MTQPQQVLPGGPASQVSSEVSEKETNIRQAVDLIGQLSRPLKAGASQEQREAFTKERLRVEGLLMELGIPHGTFGSLILSYNHMGSGVVRDSMERHFTSWDGEAAQMDS